MERSPTCLDTLSESNTSFGDPDPVTVKMDTGKTRQWGGGADMNPLIKAFRDSDGILPSSLPGAPPHQQVKFLSKPMLVKTSVGMQVWMCGCAGLLAGASQCTLGVMEAAQPPSPCLPARARLGFCQH